MTTTTFTLTAFLTARLDEDEAAARAAANLQADPENGWGLIKYNHSPGWTITPHIGHLHEDESAAFVTTFHPARVLAEVQAKRRIVALCSDNYALDPSGLTTWATGQVLRLLALPYADHDSYREEWRV